ncbi:MAG: type II toxin-antitoxin system VapC family toxin [Spirosomataceae bacterium]
MRLLLDTHVLIWYVEGNEKLPSGWRQLIESFENEKYFSIASLWEIAIKTNLGKLNIQYPIEKFVPVDFQMLPVVPNHLAAYQILPLHHRDPFDRILVVQAQVEALILMSQDPNLRLYGIEMIGLEP